MEEGVWINTTFCSHEEYDHDGHNEGVGTDNPAFQSVLKRFGALSFIPTNFSLEASLTDTSCSDWASWYWMNTPFMRKKIVNASFCVTVEGFGFTT